MSKDNKAAITEQKQRPDHLFKPGQSGNPAGRPKGSKNAQKLFMEAMQKIAEADGLTAKDIELELARVGIDKATKGDYRYWERIFAYLHGQPVQKSENVNLNADMHKLQKEEQERLDSLINDQSTAT